MNKVPIVIYFQRNIFPIKTKLLVDKNSDLLQNPIFCYLYATKVTMWPQGISLKIWVFSLSFFFIFFYFNVISLNILSYKISWESISFFLGDNGLSIITFLTKSLYFLLIFLLFAYYIHSFRCVCQRFWYFSFLF